jgi:hypothetical protein
VYCFLIGGEEGADEHETRKGPANDAILSDFVTPSMAFVVARIGSNMQRFPC